MDELQTVLAAYDGVNASIQAQLGVDTMFGLPWCLMLGISLVTIFQTTFQRA